MRTMTMRISGDTIPRHRGNGITMEEARRKTVETFRQSRRIPSRCVRIFWPTITEPLRRTRWHFEVNLKQVGNARTRGKKIAIFHRRRRLLPRRAGHVCERDHDVALILPCARMSSIDRFKSRFKSECPSCWQYKGQCKRNSIWSSKLVLPCIFLHTTLFFI